MLMMFVRFAWKVSSQVVEVVIEPNVATCTMKLVFPPGFLGVIRALFAAAASSSNELILLLW